MATEVIEVIINISNILNEYLGINTLIKFLLISGTIIGSFITGKELFKKIINKTIKKWTNKIELE